MREQLAKNNYIVVDNFVTLEEAEFLSNEMELSYQLNPEMFQNDSQCLDSLSVYDMWAFVALMLEKLPFMCEVVQEPLFPTYTFARFYKKGNILTPHIDRGACEISVTLHLGSDGVEWPICFETPDKQVVSVNLKPGQAVIYLGCVTRHWREACESSDYRQVFLHYVRARGEYREHYFDKRK
jgi:hypothetical protein